MNHYLRSLMLGPVTVILLEGGHADFGFAEFRSLDGDAIYLEQLEKGVWLQTGNGAVSAVALVQGERKVVSSGSDSDDLISKVRLLRQQKLVDLETTYGVIVGRDGGRVDLHERSMQTRTPMLFEVLALEVALEHGNPSFKPKGRRKHPLEICFLKDPYKGDVLATWTLDSKDRPVILLEPDERLSKPQLLESTLVHELSHQGQYRLGMNPQECVHWKAPYLVGWKSFRNPSTGECGWRVKCRDGKWYKRGTVKWVRCNDIGQPLDSTGGRVRSQFRAEALTFFQVRERAVVRPVTSYFTNPAEVLAEGMMMFRLSRTTRMILLRRSPELYELVKKQDQRELDEAYGVGAMARMPSGIVEVAGEETSVSISALESKHFD